MEKYLLNNPAKKKDMEDELDKFVNKHVFPCGKFPTTETREKWYCRIACHKGDVTLPTGVSKETFADQFHKNVNKRVGARRQLPHGSMKENFDSKC